MKRFGFVLSLLLWSGFCIATTHPTGHGTFGKGLCNHPDFQCVKATGSWTRMFPDERQRDIVQRVNRTYNYLGRGRVIAVPKQLEKITIYDVSPFPLNLEDPDGEKRIIVDQEKLAWAAYGTDGQLVRWGPISSGKDYCPDIGRGCRTITGVFRVFNEEGSSCRSRTFGGARMPFCMFFYKGYAMHGSNDIPGRRASHGCIRMFTRDAKWLNHEFVEASNLRNGGKGTKVVVRGLRDDKRNTNQNQRKRRSYGR